MWANSISLAISEGPGRRASLLAHSEEIQDDPYDLRFQNRTCVAVGDEEYVCKLTRRTADFDGE